MAEIVVAHASADRSSFRFRVTVREGGSSTEHHVKLSTADLERLGGGREPEDFVRACFDFLLEREPKESILPTFDISVIGGYFPGFEDAIRGL